MLASDQYAAQKQLLPRDAPAQRIQLQLLLLCCCHGWLVNMHY
jgi:hypothetical protein